MVAELRRIERTELEDLFEVVAKEGFELLVGLGAFDGSRRDEDHR